MQANVLSIEAALIATGGVIKPEIRQELDSIDLGDWAAADPIIDVIQALEAREAALRAEAAPHEAAAAPLLAKAKAAKQAVEALKEDLRTRMEKGKLNALTGPVHACRLQKNSAPKFELADPDVIPPSVAETVVKLDLAKAKVAWKDNKLPAGVTATVGWQLRIDR